MVQLSIFSENIKTIVEHVKTTLANKKTDLIEQNSRKQPMPNFKKQS